LHLLSYQWLQLEQFPLEQEEHEPLISLLSCLKDSPLEAMLMNTLNFCAVSVLPQEGQSGLAFSFIPRTISNILSQSLHI